MKLNIKTLLFFLLGSCLSVFFWFHLTYPQLAFVNLSIDKKEALSIAQNYLKNSLEIDASEYQKATVFKIDRQANRYLQKAIGFKGLLQFIKKNDYDLFYWAVRFFKENSKEEYLVVVNSSSGEIISYNHTIEENAKRDFIDKEEARALSINFLKTKFNFDTNSYLEKSDSKKNYDNRTNYFFSWKKSNVAIPWNNRAQDGSAKLETKIAISGNEILSFEKNMLAIPEKFNRDLKKRMVIGKTISSIVKIFYYLLIFSSIYFVITRRFHLRMHSTKKFYIILSTIFFLLVLLGIINDFEYIKYQYPTTSSFRSYFFNLVINSATLGFFMSLITLIPGLAGESLNHEVSPNKKNQSFSYYLHSTFFSRNVFYSILIGYFSCIILLGIQSLLIKFGQRFLDVWVEYNWMTYFSSSYWPFLAALTIGFKASLSEELTFRLFSINLGKKFLKSTVLAILFSSLLWGFAHSNYPVFPRWFRGLEVSILGVFLSLIYLRYGIISVIVTHYLFDVFWSSACYLLGTSKPIYFYNSLFVLLLPLIFGIFAFILNKKEEELPRPIKLNKNQEFNLEILKAFIREKQTKGSVNKEVLTQDLIHHGWDITLINMAIENP